MITDLRGLSEGDELRTGVCIVGAGPAGLAIAAELLDSGMDVLVIESGGVDEDPWTQQLGAGGVTGDPRYASGPLVGTRRRQIGGTANQWDIRVDGSSAGVRLVPFRDGELRAAGEWRTAWPLTSADLEPYYARAHQLLGLGPVRYASADWTTSDATPLPLTGVDTDVFQFATGERISRDLHGRVAGHPRVRLATHGTVIELVVRDDRVDYLLVATAPGRHHRVRCDRVVLAAGGIENARLLLVSARDRGGLGNENGHVGRTFMDHPLIRVGMLRSRPGVLARLRFYDHRVVRGSLVMGRLVVGREQLGGALPGSSFYLLPRPAGYDPDIASELRRAVLRCDIRAVTARLRRPRVATAVVRGAWHQMRGVWPELPHGGWSTRGYMARWPDLELVQRCEQVPDRDNRIVLSYQRDALGAPVADIRWRWSADDRAGAAAAQDVLARALALAGVGRTEVAREPDGSPRLLGGTHHHMGTTRMSADAADGVVDSDGRLHGVTNCYAAGSSVFPTSGTANPTLTIVALATRLADHLRAGPAG